VEVPDGSSFRLSPGITCPPDNLPISLGVASICQRIDNMPCSRRSNDKVDRSSAIRMNLTIGRIVSSHPTFEEPEIGPTPRLRRR
jgi:hypothetical protein